MGFHVITKKQETTTRLPREEIFTWLPRVPECLGCPYWWNVKERWVIFTSLARYIAHPALSSGLLLHVLAKEITSSTCSHTYFLITNFKFFKFWWFSCNLPNSPKFSPSKILYHKVDTLVEGWNIRNPLTYVVLLITHTYILHHIIMIIISDLHETVRIPQPVAMVSSALTTQL